ncbi:MAG: tetratricopeptide repeat protein [Desulfobulbaceae bacterium]|nr:tetratricopeptide repeat protein [Desulfobulbaceae bacterium]HIJ89479.1 tetratricopeptide repeat protein [Deltaproteobacteria bacterium]
MKVKAPKDMIFLVVDDIDNMRRSVKAMLKLVHFGKEFYEAANGRDAWKLLQDENIVIDFIICDYNMPYMSGTELLGLIRATKKWRDIPFLMVTAEANMDIVAEAAEHDVDAYMTKPFVTATLEQKVIELLGQINNPSPFNQLLLQARTLEEKGDLEGAIGAATEAAKLNDRSSKPYRELGRLFGKKGDLKKAQLCFEKAVEINRLDVSSYHALGQIYYHQGKMEMAMENFNRAMEISPRHADRAMNFAKLLIKKKQLPEAEKVLRLVLKTKSNDIDFKEDIAETCSNCGLMELAVKCYREVLKADPERIYLNKKIGLALFALGEVNEALKVLEKAAEKTSDDIDLFMALGNAYFSIKQLIRADQWVSKVLRIDPSHKEARAILDKCL